MMNRTLFVSSLDHSRLHDLVITAKQFATANTALLDALESELDKATIVPPREIPPYVVTMNTCVHLSDLESGEDRKVTLVYPSDAKRNKECLSILTDLGVAIIGYSVGDTVEWNSPTGVRKLKINSIEFQPEATKQYDL
ncbi:nucleoside diphosphate kinase regulator [Pirellulaceae bacterium SH467]